MKVPEPEDLRQIERSHFRDAARRKLPAIRETLAKASAKKQEEDASGTFLPMSGDADGP